MKRFSAALCAIVVIGLAAFTGHQFVLAGTFPTPGPTKGRVDNWYIENQGHIVGQTAYIKGWAYDPYATNDSVFVALSLTSTVTKQADLISFDSASEPRPDVASAFGLPKDNYGFRIPIPRELYDGKAHTVYVWSSTTIEDCAPRGCEPINKNTGQTLIGTVNFTGLNGGIHGALDAIDGNTAHGWAFDADSQSTEDYATVIFYACDRMLDFDNVCRNKRYIGSGTTGITRTDVAAAFPGESVGYNHGFMINLTIPSDLRTGLETNVVAAAVSHTDGSVIQLPGIFKRVFNEDGTLSEPAEFEY